MRCLHKSGIIGWLVGLMAFLRLSETGSELCRTALWGFFGEAITSFIGLYEVVQGTGSKLK